MQNYKILFIISSFNIDKIQKVEEIAANLDDNKNGNFMKYLFLKLLQTFIIVLINIYFCIQRYTKYIFTSLLIL